MKRYAYGEQSVRGCILLACMTGNIGISGGWASGSADNNRHMEPYIQQPVNTYKPKIPVYRWTDAVVRGHEMTFLEGVSGGEKLDADIKMKICFLKACFKTCSCCFNAHICHHPLLYLFYIDKCTNNLL